MNIIKKEYLLGNTEPQPGCRYSGEAKMRWTDHRHPAHAPSRGASRISGCLPRSAKCPGLYGLVKAAQHTISARTPQTRAAGSPYVVKRDSAESMALAPAGISVVDCAKTSYPVPGGQKEKSRPNVQQITEKAIRHLIFKCVTGPSAQH